MHIGISMSIPSVVKTLSMAVKSLFYRLGAGNAHAYMFSAQTPVLGNDISTSKSATLSASTGWNCQSSISPVVGKTYLVTYSYSLSAGAIQASIGGSAPGPVHGVGSGTASFNVTATTSDPPAIWANAASGSISDYTIREIISYNDLLQGFHTGNYVESTGVTPASVDQPCGLVLDAAGSVGAELSVGGDFSNSANWSVQAGFTVSGGVLSVNAGGGAITNTAGQAAVIGKTYRLDYEVTSFTSGQVKLFMGGAGGVAANGVGKFTSIVTATTTDKPQLYVTSGGTVCTVDNVSSKEITGIRASQSTSGYRPYERKGIVNLLTYSQDFSNGAWAKAGCSVTATNVDDPFGGTSASAITSSSADAAIADGFTPASGVTYTAAVWLKVPSGTQTIRVLLNGGGQLSYQDFTVTTSWQIFTVTGTTASTANLACQIGGGSTFGNGVVLHAFRGGIFQGTLTASQILSYGGIPLTTTAAASSSMGPYYLEHKAASNHKLILSSVPFQLSDSFLITAVVLTHKNSAEWQTILGQHGAGAARIQVYIETGYIKVFLRDDASVSELLASPIQLTGTVALLSIVKAGSSLKIRVNGVDSVSASLTTFGAASLTVAAIGSLGSTNSDYFDGNIYDVIPIKGTISDADVILAEKFAAQCAGITL